MGLTEDLREVPSDRIPLICFLSHRWLSPQRNYPDDENNTKLRAVINFGHWLECSIAAAATGRPVPGISKILQLFNVSQEQLKGVDLYFWIDYCCMDQREGLTELYVHTLPLYIATCTFMACYETDDYKDRAWCHLEQALAYALLPTADLTIFSFSSQFASSSVGSEVSEATSAQLLDPREGRLTVESDRYLIEMVLSTVEKSAFFLSTPFLDKLKAVYRSCATMWIDTCRFQEYVDEAKQECPSCCPIFLGALCCCSARCIWMSVSCCGAYAHCKGGFEDVSDRFRSEQSRNNVVQLFANRTNNALAILRLQTSESGMVSGQPKAISLEFNDGFEDDVLY
jgi:hypothetical protein